MRDEKNAAPVLQHQDGKAGLGAGLGRSTTSTSQCTTSAPTGARVHIADFLSPGQQNAVPMRHLRELLDLPNRTIRLMIRRERLAGVPILENSRTGYYLPADEAEATRCVRSLLHRASEILKTAAAIERGGISS